MKLKFGARYERFQGHDSTAGQRCSQQRKRIILESTPVLFTQGQCYASIQQPFVLDPICQHSCSHPSIHCHAAQQLTDAPFPQILNLRIHSLTS